MTKPSSTPLAKPSWKQRLHFLTGDRRGEAHAVAAVVAGTLHPDPERPVTPSELQEIEASALRAVEEAHSETESTVTPSSPTTTDLASPSDVATDVATDVAEVAPPTGPKADMPVDARQGHHPPTESPSHGDEGGGGEPASSRVDNA